MPEKAEFQQSAQPIQGAVIAHAHRIGRLDHRVVLFNFPGRRLYPIRYGLAVTQDLGPFHPTPTTIFSQNPMGNWQATDNFNPQYPPFFSAKSRRLCLKSSVKSRRLCLKQGNKSRRLCCKSRRLNLKSRRLCHFFPLPTSKSRRLNLRVDVCAVRVDVCALKSRRLCILKLMISIIYRAAQRVTSPVVVVLIHNTTTTGRGLCVNLIRGVT